MILKHGSQEISISEQADCMAIIYRKRNPHSEKTETTPILMDKEKFLSMFAAIADACDSARAALLPATPTKTNYETRTTTN